MDHIVVCALYKFVHLPDYQALREPLLQALEEQGVKGTLLLAEEGINGTIAGSRQAINIILDHLQSDPRFADLEYKESYDNTLPFYRTRVKLKNEIVTMGIEGIDPKHIVGTYVEATDWNELISRPDILLVDTRNHYEVQVGSFEGAEDPHTESFREFPDYVKNKLDKTKHKKIAMFCTGGIRCEKSTAYLKEQGFDEVYHLKGGILKYLEDVPEKESLWRGECFVFDNRVTVDHNLEKGTYDQCNACRLPITKEDQKHKHYLSGVSCPYCFDKISEKQRQRFQQRETQMQLAKERGETHIGSDVKVQIEKRKKEKQMLKDQQRKLGQ